MKTEHHSRSHTNFCRQTLSQKVKNIEESKKFDFSRKKICEEFGISKATISQTLKNQKNPWHTRKTQDHEKTRLLEATLYEWFTIVSKKVQLPIV